MEEKRWEEDGRGGDVVEEEGPSLVFHAFEPRANARQGERRALRDASPLRATRL